MESDLLGKILRQNSLTRAHFKGCFAADQLPMASTMQFPAGLIANTDPHEKPGSHWIAIFAPDAHKAFYMDSLCLQPIPPQIQAFLAQFSSYDRNEQSFQSPHKNTCPHHCISFLYFMSYGLSFAQYLKLLRSQPNPDLFVQTIAQKLSFILEIN